MLFTAEPGGNAHAPRRLYIATSLMDIGSWHIVVNRPELTFTVKESLFFLHSVDIGFDRGDLFVTNHAHPFGHALA